MPAGYSRRRLVEKLDLKPGTRAHLRGAPSDYLDLLGPLPEGVVVRSTLRTPVDFIQAFYDSERRLARDLPVWREGLIPGGSLWISWPKKASRVATDITEDVAADRANVVRKLALANGLVDVKVCAVDETWSGSKLVYRRADRERMAR